LRPSGRRKRERGDHRHTGQKMMLHVCDPLSRSSVGHGRHGWTIWLAAVWSKSSPSSFRWYSRRFLGVPWAPRDYARDGARGRRHPLRSDIEAAGSGATLRPARCGSREHSFPAPLDSKAFRYSLVVGASLTTKHVVILPSTQFPASCSAQLDGMI
jgi:hypothetical protein